MSYVSDAHRLTFSHTNRGGVVPVCSCGWIGRVHNPRGVVDVGEATLIADTGSAAMHAAKEHRQHVKVDGPLVIPGVPPSAVDAVRNRSRFSHS